MSAPTLREWLLAERTELLSALKVAVSAHFASLAVTYPDICGYAVMPGDGSAVDYLVAAWVRKAQIKQDTPYHRYCVDEWPNFDHDSLGSVTPTISVLNVQFAALHRYSGDGFLQDDDERAHVRLFNEAILRGLKELRKEGRLQVGGEQIFSVIWVSDSGDEIMCRSAKELNSPTVAEEFMREFG